MSAEAFRQSSQKSVKRHDGGSTVRYKPEVEIHQPKEIPELLNSGRFWKLLNRLYPLRQLTDATSISTLSPSKSGLCNAEFTLREVNDDTVFLQAMKQCTKMMLILLTVGADDKNIVQVCETK